MSCLVCSESVSSYMGYAAPPASELRAEGVDIGIISKQLGHLTIATTARYVDHIAPYAVIEALHSRRW